MDELKRKHTRIPNSRTNSEYSIAETARVRTALKALMHRYSKTAETVLSEMASLLPEELGFAFKDRGQLYEFLRGSEPFDQKVRAVIEYTALVDPDLASTTPEYGFVQLIGDSFTKFFMPNFDISRYDEKLTQQKLAQYEGVFLDATQPGNDTHITSTILLVRLVPNTAYARCDFFRLNVSEHLFDLGERDTGEQFPERDEFKRRELFMELTDQKFTQAVISTAGVREHLNDHDTDEFSRKLDEYMRFSGTFDAESVFKQTYSGICLIDPDRENGCFLCRYPLRREPSIGGITILSGEKLIAVMVSPKDTTVRYLESDIADISAFAPADHYMFRKVDCPHISKLISQTPWGFA